MLKQLSESAKHKLLKSMKHILQSLDEQYAPPKICSVNTFWQRVSKMVNMDSLIKLRAEYCQRSRWY